MVRQHNDIPARLPHQSNPDLKRAGVSLVSCSPALRSTPYLRVQGSGRRLLGTPPLDSLMGIVLHASTIPVIPGLSVIGPMPRRANAAK